MMTAINSQKKTVRIPRNKNVKVLCKVLIYFLLSSLAKLASQEGVFFSSSFSMKVFNQLIRMSPSL